MPSMRVLPLMELVGDLKEFGFQVFHAEGPAAAEARMDRFPAPQAGWQCELVSMV